MLTKKQRKYVYKEWISHQYLTFADRIRDSVNNKDLAELLIILFGYLNIFEGNDVTGIAHVLQYEVLDLWYEDYVYDRNDTVGESFRRINRRVDIYLETHIALPHYTKSNMEFRYDFILNKVYESNPTFGNKLRLLSTPELSLCIVRIFFDLKDILSTVTVDILEQVLDSKKEIDIKDISALMVTPINYKNYIDMPASEKEGKLFKIIGGPYEDQDIFVMGNEFIYRC